MVLVDTFLFYNEIDILELRLSLLDKYVDRFVLVEAEFTFMGNPKELFYLKNRERFQKWNHKIEHVIIRADEAPDTTDPWVRENFQRDQVVRGLEGLPLDATIMLSDVDEIPDLSKIKFTHKIMAVHMWMYEYSFEYMFIEEAWIGTVITNCQLFKRAGPTYFRNNRWRFTISRFSGWHLSSFGDASHVMNKIRTYSHARDDKHAEASVENLEKWIENGIHSDGQTRLVKRIPEASLPGPVEVLRGLNLWKSP